MLDTTIPAIDGKTYGDAIIYAIKLRGALLECNADKEGMREYFESVRN